MHFFCALPFKRNIICWLFDFANVKQQHKFKGKLFSKLFGIGLVWILFTRRSAMSILEIISVFSPIIRLIFRLRLSPIFRIRLCSKYMSMLKLHFRIRMQKHE